MKSLANNKFQWKQEKLQDKQDARNEAKVIEERSKRLYRTLNESFKLNKRHNNSWSCSAQINLKTSW